MTLQTARNSANDAAEAAREGKTDEALHLLALAMAEMARTLDSRIRSIESTLSSIQRDVK